MTDIAQASNVASNPAAVAKFEPDQEALCRRFDGRMHGRMAAAKDEGNWNSILTILINAHGNSNLRANVRKRFLKECPHKDLVALLEIATMIIDPKVDNTEADELFDFRQMRAMDKAKSRVEWLVVLDVLCAAEKRNNLRTPVRVYFCDLCPHPSLIGDLKKATKIV